MPMTRREIIARLDSIRDGLANPQFADWSIRADAMTLVNDLLSLLRAEDERDEAAIPPAPLASPMAVNRPPDEFVADFDGAVGVAALSVSGAAITSLKDSFARAIAAKDEPPTTVHRNLEDYVAALGLSLTGVDIKPLRFIDWPMTFPPPEPDPEPTADEARAETWRDRKPLA